MAGRTFAIGGGVPDANEVLAAPAADVYSTTDGQTWVEEADLPEARASASAIANDQFNFVLSGTTAPPAADPSVVVAAHCAFD
ncbi:MAG: hypothetical protein AAGA54_26015 [Myxococcota bacterium]